MAEEARKSLLNAIAHGIKIINFKMSDVKMRAMAVSFGSNEDNIIAWTSSSSMLHISWKNTIGSTPARSRTE